MAPRRNSLIIPKRYDKFGTVKILTVSRKQWYKNFENPSKFIFYRAPPSQRLLFDMRSVHEAQACIEENHISAYQKDKF